MTRQDLQALGLDEAAAEKVMALARADGEAREQARQAERAQWQADAAALQDALAGRERAEATRRAAAGLRFTSESARRCFLRELEDAALPVADGALEGFDDFLAAYRAGDPGALWGREQGPLFARCAGGDELTGDAVRRAFGL